jgi:hypothetical protein
MYYMKYTHLIYCFHIKNQSFVFGTGLLSYMVRRVETCFF